MSQIKEFKDQQGLTAALAAIPDHYLAGAAVNMIRQHEGVPFFITAHAIDTARNVMIFGLTDEMFTTYKNVLIKSTVNMIPNAIKTSFRDFIEPQEYLKQFAEAMAQMKLTPVAETDLPSIIGTNIQQAYNSMMTEYQARFDQETALGTPTYANNSLCSSFMVKYSGQNPQGIPCTVIAGMDYKGVEYYTTLSIASVMGPLGMLFNKPKKETGSKQFGHGSPCDAIDWGAANKFILITPTEFEEEATRDFIEFVSTFHMADPLRQQFYQLNLQRQQENLQQTMQLQAMAQQSAVNLMNSQRQLAQTLAQNSAAMSAGIMDSWNKKMASDSRISQARSEATLGINTYQNSYGQNVGVSVAADHVYENQYGDVYGVSGNAIDNDILTKLNWKELKK